ncbi:MAG TPA: GTP-binding protein [Chloroflexi bacterium]|nr:GTP-binding protein [Chloroflexota bacterium]
MDAEYMKLVVTGSFNAGKTTFIQTVNEIDGVSTEVQTMEKRNVKRQTTVAMDFGRVTLSGGLRLHLVGTPGQRRFSFMWETLILECNGVLMLVDSSEAESLDETSRMFDFFAVRLGDAPMFVVANKQDHPQALSPTRIERSLNLVTAGCGGNGGREVALLPAPGCVAHDRACVLAILESIAPHLEQRGNGAGESRP